MRLLITQIHASGECTTMFNLEHRCACRGCERGEKADPQVEALVQQLSEPILKQLATK
jgi:hypothetical protein